MNANEALEWMRSNPCEIIDSDCPARAWWRLDTGRIFCWCHYDCDCCEGEEDTDDEFLRYDKTATVFTPRPK